MAEINGNKWAVTVYSTRTAQDSPIVTSAEMRRVSQLLMDAGIGYAVVNNGIRFHIQKRESIHIYQDKSGLLTVEDAYLNTIHTRMTAEEAADKIIGTTRRAMRCRNRAAC